MPSVPEKDNQKAKKPFIHETITGETNRRSRRLRQLLLTLGLAVVFGLTASVTFVLSRPVWEGWVSEPETSESVSIARDESTAEPETTTEPVTEPEPESETAPTSEAETEDWREEVQAIVDSHRPDLEDYRSVYGELNRVASSVSRSLVTVTASSTDVDWFDNTVSANQDTCGVILLRTYRELLILVNAEPLAEFDSLKVSFGSYGEGEAYIKQQDGILGLAVVAVPLKNLDAAVLDAVTEIELGNSYNVAQGQPVLAVGRPLGYSRSLAYGMISYINPNVQGTDAQLRLLQTDIPYSEKSCGMLVDVEGRLVGWLTTKYSSSTTDGFLSALSISDLKPWLEKLSNGKAIACLGIRGQTVTAEIAEKQTLPTGVYITRCITDRPAYLEGLQSGDVLTAIDDMVITSMDTLQRCLEQYDPGDLVTVTAQREGREGYKEFTVDLVLQAR